MSFLGAISSPSKMRRRTIVGGQIALLSLLVLIALWYRDALAETFKPIERIFPNPDKVYTPEEPISISRPTEAPEVASPEEELKSVDDGGITGVGSDDEAEVKVEAPKVLNDSALSDQVRAIFDPDDTTFQRLECPVPTKGLPRYETLKPSAESTTDSDSIKYFFALDLKQSVGLLPRLLGSVVEAIRFLGPENCVLSIVEGNSDDGTPEVLEAIRPEIEALGTEYFLLSSDVDPFAGEGQRIIGLAKLRNLALQPMLDDARRYTVDSVVVFLNDVAICMEDILELVYQKSHTGADMTCAMDWTYVGRDPTFYDIWIARTITGETFFNIPEDRSWDYAWNLFWADWDTKRRYSSHLPFQVFSCWNGAVTFTAAPLLAKEVSFRSSNQGECFQGEPELLCKDLWHKGWNKIAVVPSVNLEYTDEHGRDIKALKGYTSKWVGPDQDEKSRIDWIPNPPDQVKCLAVMELPEWRPWNETLTATPPPSVDTRKSHHRRRR